MHIGLTRLLGYSIYIVKNRLFQITNNQQLIRLSVKIGR